MPASPASDVQAAFFANTAQGVVEGQHLVRGQLVLRALGFEHIPVMNVENACASASTALNAAFSYVASGQGDMALAVGAEKMNSKDREKSFAIFDGAWDVHDVDGSIRRPDGARQGSRAAAGRRPEQRQAQRLHGRLCVARALSHASLRNDPARYRRGIREEPSALDAESQGAVPGSHDRRRCAGGARGVLAADAADVRADQRRRGRGHRLFRGEGARARSRRGRSASLPRCWLRRLRPGGRRPGKASLPARVQPRLRDRRRRPRRYVGGRGP